MVTRLIAQMRPTIHEMEPYVPGKPIAEVQKEYGIQDVIKLASNENPLGPSEKVKDAIRNILDDLHRYPDGSASAVKAALAQHFELSEDYFIVGNGSDEVIKLLSETFLQPGDEVVLPVPSFSEYLFGTLLMAAKPVTVALQSDFTYDVDAMLAAITPRTKMLYLCSPNNPTGTYATKEQLDRLINELPEGVVVVLDEAYNEYAVAGDYPQGTDYVRSEKPVIVMRTFSKLYALAALRIGYAIAHPTIISFVNRVREPFNVNTVAQVAAVTALSDEEHVALARETNERGKAILYAGFDAMGLHYIPTQTNFILVDVENEAMGVFDALMRRGLIVRSGFAGLPTWIRVTVGKEHENERLLRELVAVLG